MPINASSGIKSFPCNHNITDMLRPCSVRSVQSHFIAIHKYCVLCIFNLYRSSGTQARHLVNINDFYVNLHEILMSGPGETSQNVIDPVVVWKQLYFTRCITTLLAFADTLDNNNQCYRSLKALSSLCAKL